MNIALFTDNFFPELGGIQDSIALHAKTLGTRGHNVVIVAPAASHADFTHAHLPHEEINLGDNVHIIRVPSFHVMSPTHQSRIAYPSLSTWKSLEPFSPDIIHVHTFFTLGFAARRAARKLGIPLVGTNHWAITEFSHYWIGPAQPFVRTTIAYVNWFYSRCSLVSGPSSSTTVEMIKRGFQKPTRVISNPIDIHTFIPVDTTRRETYRAEFDMTGPALVYAGRFAVEKCIDVIVRALPMVLAKHPSTKLYLAGHGEDRARLTEISRQLHIEKHLVFTGTLSKEKLARLYAAADLFTMASTSETQGMVLLQACAAGLPVVAARWRALKEYTTPENGLLAAPYDSDDFAEKINELLGDEARLTKLRASAPGTVAQFAPEDIVAEWEEIYKKEISEYRAQKTT